MKAVSSGNAALAVLFFLAIVAEMETISASSYGGGDRVFCPKRTPCFLRYIRCPWACPSTKPWNNRAKYCQVDCYSRKCEAVCKSPKPGCHNTGTGCGDPRFVGGDGVVFYFHGRRDEHFTLVSDPRFQINARFIGLRPVGRPRDFTWIQALGFMFGSHMFTVEATRAEKWDDAADHLQFSFQGELLELPQGHRSSWSSPDNKLTVERTERTNIVMIRLEQMAIASITVAPVTKEDDRIHKYQIPVDDCFAHLDVQFSFYGLSPEVEGVLGRTYQPDYVNPAKQGVAMPVLGGENKYWTPSLVSPECNACVFTTDAGINITTAET